MRLTPRRLWTWALSFAAGLVVLAATLSGIFEVAVWLLPGYRTQLEAALTQASGHPVGIGALALRWHGLEPVLELDQVTMRGSADTADAGAAPAVSAERLQIGFLPWRLLSKAERASDFWIYDLKLGLDVDAEGAIRISGFAPGSHHVDVLSQLSHLHGLRIQSSELTISDARLPGPPLRLRIDDARLERRGPRRHIQLHLHPPAGMARTADLDAVIDGDPQESFHTRWSLAVDDIAGWPWLNPLLAPGVRIELNKASLRASGEFQDGQPLATDLNLKAASIEARRDEVSIARVQGFAVQGHSQSEPERGTRDGWHLRLDPVEVVGAHGAWPRTQIEVQYTPPPLVPLAQGDTTTAAAALPPTLAVQASFLRVEDLLSWLGALKTPPLSSEAMIELGGLSGDLHEARLDLTRLPAPALAAAPTPAPATPPAASLAAPPPKRFGFDLGTRFSGLGLSHAKSGNAVAGLAGTLHASLDGAQVELEGGTPSLSLPGLFAQPLKFDKLAATVAVVRDASGTSIDAQSFAIAIGPDRVGGSVEFKIPPQANEGDDSGAPAHSPQLNLHANFTSTDIAALKAFMPASLNEHTRAWVNRALVGGRISRGNAVLEGPLADFPFIERPTGHWGVDFDFVDGVLAFAPDWPAAEALKGTMRLGGRSASVHLESGREDGMPIRALEGKIADFGEANLIIDGTAAGDSADAYSLLRQSPLQTRLAGLLNHTEASGPGSVDLHLECVLKGEKPPVHASGTVHLDDTTIQVKGLDAPFTGIHGAINFGPGGARASGLTAQFRDAALTAEIVGDTTSPEGVLQAHLLIPVIGPVAGPGQAAAGIFETYLPGFVRARLSGSASWLVRLPFSGPTAGRVLASSDLRGLESRMPPPLRKHADSELPLSLEVRSDTAAPLLLNLNTAPARMALRFARQDGHLRTVAVAARLGAGEMPQASEDGIVVEGAPARLDAPAWLGFIATLNTGDAGTAGGPAPLPALATADATPGSAGAGLTLRRLDLSPGIIDAGEFEIPDVRLRAAATPAGVDVQFEGPGTLGSVVWTRADGGHAVARFDRLHARVQPSVAGVAAPPPNADTVDLADAEPLNPANAPTVDARVNAMQLGDADFGQLEFNSSRIANGQSMDLFTTRGGVLEIDASGTWRRLQGSSSAQTQFKLASKDLAAALAGGGYAQSVSSPDANFDAKLAWTQDTPLGLELTHAQGDLKIAIHGGVLNVVDPGAGRILGLLNLYALPRRLIHGFSDVTDKGFAFSEVSGDFKLGGGNALTQNLEIAAPSAAMHVRGRVGLVARDYDEEVRVRPKVSTSLTVGAAILGGPVGAGIALVAQELFGEPLDRLTEFTYHLGGSWDNPKMTRGSEVEAPAAASPPAKGPSDAAPKTGSGPGA